MDTIAFVFAGQGAQYPGMGQSLYENSAAAKEVLDRCEALRPGTLAMCFEGTAEQLAQTVNTQPCVFAVDLACAFALQERGINPQMVAGFSLGELAAVCFVGLMSVEEAFELVCRRAEAMQDSARNHPAGMAAVLRLADADVEKLCAQAGNAYPVNYNCPGQVSVSGTEDGLGKLEKLVAEQGGRMLRLKVSGGFHSPFMAEAAQEMAKLTGEIAFGAARLPVYANLTAQPYERGAEAQTLADQVKNPVLWQKSIENMQAQGAVIFVELGPGKTLSGLIKKIGGASKILNVENTDTLNACVEKLEEA